MSKASVVFVVGHSNWGKSRTLLALTDGDVYERHIEIGDAEFFIRRMSNDDRLRKFADFLESISPESKPLVIATICPNFNDDDPILSNVLGTLQKKGYQLFFWVIEHKHGRPTDVVTPDEIRGLREFGKVEVFSGSVEAGERAKAFRKFVAEVVLG